MAPSAQAAARAERDERYSQRAGARAMRNAAADLRQQSLQEVMVMREQARPDAAPAARPRRSTADGRWSRERAWEEAQAAVRPRRLSVM